MKETQREALSSRNAKREREREMRRREKTFAHWNLFKTDWTAEEEAHTCPLSDLVCITS